MEKEVQFLSNCNMSRDDKVIYTTLNIERGIIFQAGNFERDFTIEKAIEFSRLLREQADYLNEMQHLAKYVDNFEEEKFIKGQEERVEDSDPEEKFPYGTGWQCFHILPKEHREKGNHDGADFLLKEFKKEYGKNTIKADPEYSYSYFYAKKLEDIVAFEKFIIEKFALPALQPYR